MDEREKSYIEMLFHMPEYDKRVIEPSCTTTSTGISGKTFWIGTITVASATEIQPICTTGSDVIEREFFAL